MLKEGTFDYQTATIVYKGSERPINHETIRDIICEYHYTYFPMTDLKTYTEPIYKWVTNLLLPALWELIDLTMKESQEDETDIE